LPGSRAALRPWQGYALAEAANCGGAFLGLGVGHGKTLISFLLPVLLEAARPVLVIPASLREKTYKEFGDLARDWRYPTPYRVTTLQELAPERGAYLLEQLAPDLIVVDECDELANPKSSAARRLDRYIIAHPEVRLVCMTGTPSRRSILNYWHLLCWCLRDGAPVPLVQSEADVWAGALDDKAPGRGAGWHVRPGPLGGDREAAREWYRARLVETPGVVIVDGDSCDAPLTIRVRLAREDRILDDAFASFLKTLETPDGLPVSDPLSRWRMDGQLGCGLYLRWRPQPPQRWRDARRNVARFVRDRIAHSTNSAKPLDTEAQVLRRFDAHPIVLEWLAVRDTFEPSTEAVWVSDSTIQSVRDWIVESPTPGIVWTGCVEFAEALSAATRLPYYGREGKNQHGQGLHAADPSRSLIASWHANKRGFNLQAWARQLVTHPPQSAKYLEQIFGRSHRAGQLQHVIVDMLATSGGTLDSFEAAISEAGFASSTVGLQQKILRADIQRAAPRVTASNKYRWARKGGTKEKRDRSLTGAHYA
jgi:hypothetical protein